MIRRRFTASLAALAVIASGLLWGAAPASAAGTATAASIDVSQWPVSSSPAVVVSWTNSTLTSNSAMVRSPWPWGASWTAATGSASTGGTWDGNDARQVVTCSGSGAVFTISEAKAAAQPSCNYANSAFWKGFWLSGLTIKAGATISVSIAAGQVTAPATARTDTWLVGEYDLNPKTYMAEIATTAFSIPIPLITINIDANGGRCNTNAVTGYQGTWTTAPDSSSCARAGSLFTGFNTKSDGSGLAIAPGGNLNLTGDNTLFAQYEIPRTAGAPTDVIAKRGYQVVTVSWTPPEDSGSSNISNYLVQATPGGQVCITNLRSANLLECSYDKGRLTSGVKYTFKVQALNSSGWGPMSAESNGATPFDLRFDSLSREKDASFLFIGGGSTLEASGKAPGIAAGTTLTPHVQIGANGKWQTETRNLPKVDAKGTYSWSKKLARNLNGQPASVYFTFNDVKTRTLTTAVGASAGLPGAPRDLKVSSSTDGITVSWKAPGKDGGSPVTNYIVKSDLGKISCNVKAPQTSCTQYKKSGTTHDPGTNYTFSVAAQTQRGTGNEAQTNWRGELYRLNISSRQLDGDDITLGYDAKGFSCSQKFEVQAKVGNSGKWIKQSGAATLNPATCSFGRWTGVLPKAPGGTEVNYRLKSPNGFSNERRIVTPR